MSEVASEKSEVSTKSSVDQPPTSARKILANRRNALRSPGPTTKAGKKRASQNSIKHGLLSREVVNRGRGESLELFNSLLEALRAEYEPVGQVEEILVATMAKAFWDRECVLRAKIGEISKRRNEVIDKLRSKRLNQFRNDLLCWEVMRVQLARGEIDKEIPFMERARSYEELTRNLRRTQGGVAYLSAVLKMMKAEIKKKGSLPNHARMLMIDCFGWPWVYLIPAEACSAGKQFNEAELKTLFAMMEEEASALKVQKDYIDKRDEAELEAEMLIASLPPEDAMHNLMRYDTHPERQFYRVLAELDRQQARRKGEAVPPRIQVQLE